MLAPTVNKAIPGILGNMGKGHLYQGNKDNIGEQGI